MIQVVAVLNLRYVSAVPMGTSSKPLEQGEVRAKDRVRNN